MITEYCRNFTPEQMNMWRNASGLIAWNTCTSIFYQGVLAASEFTVYNAAKLYIALEFESSSGSGPIATMNFVAFYNIANAVCSMILNNIVVWDGTAAAFRFCENYIQIKNIYFSRITTSVGNQYIKFNGFRLTTI